VDGVGAPLVAVGRTEDPQFRQHYGLRRVYASVTAVIKFSGRRAELEFVDPLASERITLGKHTFPLAADFTASTAMLMARERPERIGFARVFRPEAYADTARLFQLQQFDRARTPVIFVHGLQDTPASWAPMINSLSNDRWVREHYQFWVFSYPSGYPYPYSAMLLRHDLDGIARVFPNRKRVVLIGHSMGGMIARLMVTDAGDRIWRDFFGTAPAKTPLTGETRHLLEEALVFNHRPEIKRVVFISTPHRGSSLGQAGSAASARPWLGLRDSWHRFMPHSSRLRSPIPSPGNSIACLTALIHSTLMTGSCSQSISSHLLLAFRTIRSSVIAAGATHRTARMALSRIGVLISMARNQS
jgi:pimeloyl-ACP methyl ester carboxylesterase